MFIFNFRSLTFCFSNFKACSAKQSNISGAQQCSISTWTMQQHENCEIEGLQAALQSRVFNGSISSSMEQWQEMLRHLVGLARAW